MSHNFIERPKRVVLGLNVVSLFYSCFRALADTDADGRMNMNEFSIACKLINLKLRGFEVPKVLPPTLLMSLASVGGTPSRTPTGAMSPVAGGPPPVPPQPLILQQQQQHQAAQHQQAAVAPPRPAIPPQPVLAQQFIQQQQPVAAVGGPPPIPPQPSVLPQAAGIAAQPYMNNVVQPLPPPQQAQPIMPGYTLPNQPIYASQPTAVVKPMEVNLLDSSLIGGIAPPPTQPVSLPTAIATQIPASIPGQIPGQIPASIPGQIPSMIPTAGIQPTSMAMGATYPGITPLPVATMPPAAIPGTFPNVIPGQTAVIPPLAPAVAAPIPAAIPAPPTPPSGTQSRSMSITGDRAPSIESPPGQADWAIKGPAKLKYTQLFNSIDRTRRGFLTGAQARGVLLQSKLPQMTLAQIWTLSDMDQDGCLGCEEFVLAMYLCDLGLQGEPIPTTLPPDLVPPSFRKTVGSKVASRAGSVVSSRHGSVSSQGAAIEPDPLAGLPQSKCLLSLLDVRPLS